MGGTSKTQGSRPLAKAVEWCALQPSSPLLRATILNCSSATILKRLACEIYHEVDFDKLVSSNSSNSSNSSKSIDGLDSRNLKSREGAFQLVPAEARSTAND